MASRSSRGTLGMTVAAILAALALAAFTFGSVSAAIDAEPETAGPYVQQATPTASPTGTTGVGPADTGDAGLLGNKGMAMGVLLLGAAAAVGVLTAARLATHQE